VGVAVIGLGFMGMTHARAYHGAGPRCRLRAAYDTDPSRLAGDGAGSRGGNLPQGQEGDDPLASVVVFDSLAALLAEPGIDAVSICTPTDTHAAIASAALEAGKHVLVEKPVSLDRDEIRDLDAAARRAGRVCMPAMCMRFWPEWVWLRDRVTDGQLGGLRSLFFERLGPMPDWGGGFYTDPARSGGALHDLHIHDTDFVCAALGPPASVLSAGDINRLTTIYRYDNGPGHVVAAGGWLRGGPGFTMRYTAEFEHATAVFDLAADPPLVVFRDGEREAVRPPRAPATGYDGEIEAFLHAVETGQDPPVTLADAGVTLAVLEAEARSIRSGEVEAV
ncbi:MAG TPA: Gfo/Idh/MocA family oxidoreductase, partial [Phycisphaerales bacterium]|nr:Gfo/Idh/MocA family oxidoreductase [Phycisphaerales bacterium]